MPVSPHSLWLFSCWFDGLHNHRKYQVKPHSSPSLFSMVVLLPKVIEITFFVCTNFAKRLVKLPSLHMLIKRKSPSLPRNLALGALDELPIVFSTMVNLLYLLYSSARKCCLLHLIKQNFSKNSNLDDSGISLPVFPSRNNRKLHNISVTPKMVKKI